MDIPKPMEGTQMVVHPRSLRASHYTNTWDAVENACLSQWSHLCHLCINGGIEDKLDTVAQRSDLIFWERIEHNIHNIHNVAIKVQLQQSSQAHASESYMSQSQSQD